MHDATSSAYGDKRDTRTISGLAPPPAALFVNLASTSYMWLPGDVRICTVIWAVAETSNSALPCVGTQFPCLLGARPEEKRGRGRGV